MMVTLVSPQEDSNLKACSMHQRLLFNKHGEKVVGILGEREEASDSESWSTISRA